MYTEILEEIEAELGEAPRSFDLWDRCTWYVQDKPAWKWKEDDIRHAILLWKDTFKNGKLAWGHIVQANVLMFEKGKINCPGEVLIWPEQEWEFNPATASAIAGRLYDLKGKSHLLTDPELKRYAEHLEDEMRREYGLKIPPSIVQGLDLRTTLIFFQRRHMPGGVLSNSFFPILYRDADPMTVVMVPSILWPRKLRKLWRRR